MDQPYIDALVNQALGAYKAGGDEGLKRWMQALPPPHLEAFQRDCAEPLRVAIEALGPAVLPGEAQPDKDATQPSDPRQQHRRDRRRTKPL